MAKETKKENEAVVSAVSVAEQFLEKNKKRIWGAVAALVIVAGGIYLFYKYSYVPSKEEAMGQMFRAEANFRAGNYDIALNGDGNVLGFNQIIAEYGSKAGKAVYLYAAICEMQRDSADADAALALLAKYSTSDPIMAGRSEALKGDAYCLKGNNAKAVSCYEKAARRTCVQFGAEYLLKAGLVYEAMGDNAAALAAYRKIKDAYPDSIEAYDIDKYITRVEVK